MQIKHNKSQKKLSQRTKAIINKKRVIKIWLYSEKGITFADRKRNREVVRTAKSENRGKKHFEK